MIRCACAAFVLAAASTAGAGPLRARDTADVGAKGSYSVGVLKPLTVAMADGIELQGHPLLFFVAPNLVVRVRHGELAGFRIAGEYGASCPTPAMKLSQGYFFPSWDHDSGKVGWFLVPSAGLLATRGDVASHALTLRADVAVGIPLSHNDATSPGGIAPLDDLLAPIFTGFRTRVGAVYDVSLLDWLRVRANLGLSLHGTTVDVPSPWTITGGVGFDVAVGASSRFTVGVMWWSSDTHAIDARTHARVRSNDFFPTLDFIWAG